MKRGVPIWSIWRHSGALTALRCALMHVDVRALPPIKITPMMA
jgi:hypothetical protein